ncbi:EAL domain-containing protein [Roseitranquillus sediminis]|uniref:EAL domain-containing protein n=1 Tax=Roseitranquillus sediminis TaxID=2809051 RepID=UPI001D0C6675|nr:EAL domain-containing protein [Roseitranquillus sediminis]MBM9596435.1 GGDEF domain-containing protein [Roseitranquillus sediminis]
MSHRVQVASRRPLPQSRIVGGPILAASIPSVMLGGYWLGGETALAAAAAVLSAAAGITALSRRDATEALDAQTGLPLRDTAVAHLDELLAAPSPGRRTGAVIVLRLEAMDVRASRLGPRERDGMLLHAVDQIIDTLRDGDRIVRLEGRAFAIILARGRNMGVETAVAVAKRVAAAATRPMPVQGGAARVDVTIGICPEARRPSGLGEAYLRAAEIAADFAEAHGPSAIRVWSDEMARQAREESDLGGDVAAALEAGDIRPWFQPQIEAESGRIVGFEALARWHHPERGVLLPAAFLESVSRQGLGVRLFQAILSGTCRTLSEWQKAGYRAPAISINVSADVLLDPTVVETVRWELDRHDLSPERIGIEVLETVVAGEADDIIVRNVETLARLGCVIELDDFGTGHASFGAMRRFGVQRIKIDQSYVRDCDICGEQRRMLAAILGMARTLAVETLAEGVESLGEQGVVASLGCDCLQGFAIARAMEPGPALLWAQEHDHKLRLSGIEPAVETRRTRRPGLAPLGETA